MGEKKQKNSSRWKKGTRWVWMGKIVISRTTATVTVTRMGLTGTVTDAAPSTTAFLVVVTVVMVTVVVTARVATAQVAMVDTAEEVEEDTVVAMVDTAEEVEEDTVVATARVDTVDTVMATARVGMVVMVVTMAMLV